MASRFGWCMTGHHKHCPGYFHNPDGDLDYYCSCECHNKDEGLVPV